MWPKLKKRLSYLKPSDILFVKRALEFAQSAHQGQKRISGEDYLTHPYAVALYLANYKFSRDVIAAGLLHDVLEDTKIKQKDLEKKFNKTVAKLVDGVSLVGDIQTKAKINFKNNDEERQFLKLQKLILASALDLRVVFIRLLDRKHNLETLDVFPRFSQIRKAKETLAIYAPLSKKLGMDELGAELEDYSFKFLHPKTYQQVLKIRKKYAPVNLKIVKKIRKQIKKKLELNKIKIIKIDYRIKHLYSLYQKLKKNDMDISRIYDLAAMRIITNTKKSCYEILGLIHSLYQPMEGRIKDYIANPKPRGYQSLHTTVFIKGDQPIEIQIRTLKMHHYAEYGLASHWLYKENVQKIKMQQWFFRLNKLIRQEKYSLSNLFREQIYVFTPKGEVIELPQGSTALDFAYAIHTQIGHQAKHILVNNQIKPFDYKLHNSDVVEIKTDKNFQISALWLRKVITNEAKNKIKSYLRLENKEEKIKIASSRLDHFLRIYNLKKADWDKKESGILKNLKMNLEQFYLTIYEEKINLDIVIKKYFKPNFSTSFKKKQKEETKVVVSGFNDLYLKLAKCCQPRKNNSIVGYISRKHQIIIHKKNCPSLVRLNKERLIPAWWEGEKQKLEIAANDRLGLLSDITNLFSHKKINILTLSAPKCKKGQANLRVAIDCPDMLRLSQLVEEINAINGVKNTTIIT